MPTIMRLFYGHALGEVTRLVHVVTLGLGQLCRKNLQRNSGEQRHQQGRRLRDVEDVLGVGPHGFVTFFGDHQGARTAGADFLDVADDLGVEGIAAARRWHHDKDGLPFVDQGNRDRA